MLHAAVIFTLPADVGVKNKLFGGMFSIVSATGDPSIFLNIQKP